MFFWFATIIGMIVGGVIWAFVLAQLSTQPRRIAKAISRDLACTGLAVISLTGVVFVALNSFPFGPQLLGNLTSLSLLSLLEATDFYETDFCRVVFPMLYRGARLSRW